jgi:type I restriction enzyme S subunit
MKTLSEFIDFNPSVALEKGCDYSFIGMERIQPGMRYVQSKECRAFTGGGARFLHEDTLFARITPCLENGKIAQFVAEPGICGFGSTELFVLRAKQGISDPSFVYYLAQTDEIRSTAIQSMVGASGRQRADINSLKTLAFALPALDKQQEIGKILSYYDDLIETNRRRIALLEESARLLYREWFVKLRFPGHESVKWQDGVPEGWRLKKFGEIVDAIGGATPNTKRMDFWDGDIVWLTPTDVTRNDCLFLPDSARRITEFGYESCSTFLLPAGTIFMTSRASIGYFALNATGATFKELSKKKFRELPAIVPDYNTLEAFENATQPIIEQVISLKKQLVLLITARDELLPKLMSGTIQI